MSDPSGKNVRPVNMRVHRISICAKLQGGFLQRWWAGVVVGALLIAMAVILDTIFPKLVNIVINKEIFSLLGGGRTFGWWKEPPATPQMHVYIYNVTNTDEFLNNGKKPALQELGPYDKVREHLKK